MQEAPFCQRRVSRKIRVEVVGQYMDAVERESTAASAAAFPLTVGVEVRDHLDDKDIVHLVSSHGKKRIHLCDRIKARDPDMQYVGICTFFVRQDGDLTGRGIPLYVAFIDQYPVAAGCVG